MPLGLPALAFLSMVFRGWGVTFPMVSQDLFFVLLGWYPQWGGSPVPLLPGILELADPPGPIWRLLWKTYSPHAGGPVMPGSLR